MYFSLMSFLKEAVCVLLVFVKASKVVYTYEAFTQKCQENQPEL